MCWGNSERPSKAVNANLEQLIGLLAQIAVDRHLEDIHDGDAHQHDHNIEQSQQEQRSNTAHGTPECWF